jgi:hypothetical protein
VNSNCSFVSPFFASVSTSRSPARSAKSALSRGTERIHTSNICPRRPTPVGGIVRRPPRGKASMYE